MNPLEQKILKAIENNKLNPNIFGERHWYNYFIKVEGLVWARNLCDGYLIHVYSDGYKSEHLDTFTLEYVFNKPTLFSHVDDYNKNIKNKIA